MENIEYLWGAALWILLSLASCRPGFESVSSRPSTLLSFIVLVLILTSEKNEKKQKEAGFGPF